jgi:hypothetical protein
MSKEIDINNILVKFKMKRCLLKFYAVPRT